MPIPIIEEYHSPETPLEIFRRMNQSSRISFFLDSVCYHPPDQAYSYIGANPFLEATLEKGKLKIAGAESGIYPASQMLGVLRRLFKKYRSATERETGFFTGGAVGLWGYELAELFEDFRFKKKSVGARHAVPLLYLGFYHDLIVYDHKKKIYRLVAHSDSRRAARIGIDRLKKYFETSSSLHFLPAGRHGARNDNPFQLKKFRPEISREHFESMVRKAKSYIAAGDIYQANLSQRFSFEFSGDPLEIYENLRRINPSPFASFLKVDDLQIVSSSPERLIAKRGRHCETRPIAGTRPRYSGQLSSRQIEKELLHNEKERAEHIMLVDLERNDLGRVCDYRTVRVKEMMKTEKYSHVIHIVSKITGCLAKGKDALDLIRAMFPGGTVTGCPKIRCMEIIDELEPVRRGIYTGSIGYLDFKGDLDLNIVIRTLVLKKDKGYLQVGAGIVHDSDPVREYEETLHKGEALAEALCLAGQS